MLIYLPWDTEGQSHETGAAVRDLTVDDSLYVGAVKANVGHLDGCSCIAAVTKHYSCGRKASSHQTQTWSN